MNKIKKFKDLILKGKTREQARDESGVANTTSKIQFAKIKKEGLLKEDIKKEESQVVEDSKDITIEQTND